MKILVIEDEKRLADSIKAMLEAKGFQVELAYDGEEGTQYAELGFVTMISDPGVNMLFMVIVVILGLHQSAAAGLSDLCDLLLQ